MWWWWRLWCGVHGNKSSCGYNSIENCHRNNLTNAWWVCHAQQWNKRNPTNLTATQNLVFAFLPNFKFIHAVQFALYTLFRSTSLSLSLPTHSRETLNYLRIIEIILNCKLFQLLIIIEIVECAKGISCCVYHMILFGHYLFWCYMSIHFASLNADGKKRETSSIAHAPCESDRAQRK